MIALIICAHGNSAQELLKSAEMICGHQQNVATIPFSIGMNPDQLDSNITNAINNLDTEDGILCLTDLKGGTPFNVLVRMTRVQKNIEIITAVSVPMLLEVFIKRPEKSLADIALDAEHAGHDAVYRYKLEKVKDDDF